MTAASPVSDAFDLKSVHWVLTALRLRTTDLSALAAAMQERFGDNPGLFEDEPLALDLSGIQDRVDVPAFGDLLTVLRAWGLRPLAVQGGHTAQQAAALAVGLPTVHGSERPPAQGHTDVPEQALTPSPAPEPDPAPAPDAEASTPATAAEPASRQTLVLDRALRSGQRAYARGGDLVILGGVSFGAEVIADGNIHVYGPLRGRAMAGARGDIEARVFSTAMEPQLVSIAGIYRTAEQPLPNGLAGRAAQVRLDGERLLVEPLPA